MAKVERLDLVLVAEDAELEKRIRDLAAEFQFEYAVVKSVDELAEKYVETQIHFIVLSTGQIEKADIAAGHVQVARQIAPDGYIFVSVGKKMDAKAADWIRKSGADQVVLEAELFNSVKLDFIAIQRLKAAYMPVKSTDFKVNTKIEFNVYHLLAQNKKYLPVVHKGMSLDEKRAGRLGEAGEVYVRRQDIAGYQAYVAANQDQSAAGLISRCRAQFLLLSVAYSDLVMLLTGQSESASFEEGRELIEKCQKFSGDLLNSLMAAGQVWEVVNSSVIGEFGSVERAPARAAYAGFFSLMGDIGSPEDTMLSALLADIGLLAMNFSPIRKIREGRMAEFTPEELQDYQQHPLRSLNLALGRKLNLKQEVKDAVQYSHARTDSKGFPEVKAEKLSVEAQLINFVSVLDERCQVRMGKPKPIFKEEYKKLLEDASEMRGFSFTFINLLKKVEL